MRGRSIWDDDDEFDALDRFAVARLAAHCRMPQAAAEAAVRRVIAGRGDAVLDLVLQLSAVAPEHRQLGQFLAAAWDCFGEQHFLARHLVAGAPAQRAALDEIVATIAPAGEERRRVHQVAQWLRANAGVSVEGFHIEAVGDKRGSALWSIVPLE
jgi:hypothetical protein